MSTNNFLKRVKKLKPLPGDHTMSQCDHRLNDKLIHHKPKNAREDKQIVTMLESRLKRNLIVPSRDVTTFPAIWSANELKRLEEKARVITLEEKLAMDEEAQARKLKLLLESEARTKELQQIDKDLHGSTAVTFTAEEIEAANKRKYVLERAYELRQENEDEIKNANTVILAAKCLVIRKAQLAEKALMKKDWAEENRKLDNMMEQERQKQLRAEEERKRVRKDRNQTQVQTLSQQIYENEVQRLIEIERKEEESRNINQALIRMQRDDVEKVRLKNLENQRTMAILDQANKDIEQFKIVQKEEQRIADLRIKEFMRKKEEREAKHNAEVARIKDAKEKERQRLLEEQSKALMQAADEAEFLALRVQEEIERRWREKERLAVIKRKQDNEDLRIARDKQMEDIRKQQALEIEKEEAEFHKVAKLQQLEYERDCERRRKKTEAAVKHRKELLQQINEKELRRIASVKEKFEEGRIIQMEDELRTLKLKNIMRKKIQRLRENEVPEQCVADIERTLKV